MPLKVHPNLRWVKRRFGVQLNTVSIVQSNYNVVQLSLAFYLALFSIFLNKKITYSKLWDIVSHHDILENLSLL